MKEKIKNYVKFFMPVSFLSLVFVTGFASWTYYADYSAENFWKVFCVLLAINCYIKDLTLNLKSAMIQIQGNSIETLEKIIALKEAKMETDQALIKILSSSK